MNNLTITIKMILFILIPIIISFIIWGVWMNPQTYLERFISMMFGLMTIIILGIIEIWIIANKYSSKHY